MRSRLFWPRDAVECPTCMGDGDAAITSKDALLSHLLGDAPIEACPRCKGKGHIQPEKAKESHHG